MNKYFYPHIPPSWIAAPPMQKVAGSSFKWGNDLFPQSPDSPTNAKFDSDDIVYEINSLGYREKEFKESYFEYDELFLGFGNSSVAGTGIAEKDVFLRVIENTIPNSRVLNLAVAKGACDTVARMVACTVPYFKTRCKKLSVIIMWPQEVRREVFTDNIHEAITPWSSEPYPGFFNGIDPTSCKYNRDRNSHMVELVCELYNVDVYYVPWHMYSMSINPEITKTDSARDGVSPSSSWHLKFAECVLNQIDAKAQGKSQ